MRYQVARFVDDTTIEVQPGSYFWRFRAVRAAKELNGAVRREGGFLVIFGGQPAGWKAFRSDVLARAIAHADERKWQALDKADRDRRAKEFLNLMKTPPAAPARSIHWLDEDPTDHEGARYAEPEDTTSDHDEVRTSWGVTEENWDQANGGSLEGGKELPVRVPADEIVNATAEIPLEDVDKAWAGVQFLPLQLEPEDIAQAQNGVLVIPQEVTLPPAVEEFLANAPMAVKRPARKRPVRKTTGTGETPLEAVADLVTGDDE